MKTIGVREFLRGGYQKVENPILVMSHSRPVGIWMPYDEKDSPITFSIDASETMTSSNVVYHTSTEKGK